MLLNIASGIAKGEPIIEYLMQQRVHSITKSWGRNVKTLITPLPVRKLNFSIDGLENWDVSWILNVVNGVLMMKKLEYMEILEESNWIMTTNIGDFELITNLSI